MNASLPYRPDIDGLRAMAVLPVILFHLGLGGPVSGGFVGVDVFFVISGYLITSIIQNDIVAGRFSLIGFYERRILRILPALFAVFGACAVFGWFNLLPQDFIYFGKGLGAASAFSSNILFWLNSGYFAPESDLVLLLHTWSLAVEEQFYIIFPLLLMALAYSSKRMRFAVLAVLFVLSFGFSYGLIPSEKSFAFYMLPTRAWELLAGSFLALVTVPALKNRVLMEILSLAGIAAIAYAVITFDKNTLLPGLPATLPVLGAMLVIYTGRHGIFWGQKILSLKPAVFFGRMSYSLYLWHWPLIVFFKYAAPWKLTYGWMLVLFVLCVAVSYLSWRFIEQPARQQQKIRGKKLVLYALLGCLFFALMGAVISAKEGFAIRFLPDLVKLATTEPHPVLEQIADIGQPVGYRFILGNTAAKATFVIWGDSHAHAAAAGLNELAKEKNTKGYILGVGSCFPSMQDIPVMEDKCNAINRTNLDFINKHPEIKTIALIARWSSGPKKFDADAGNPKETHPRPLEYYTGALIDYLTKQGRRVIVVTEVPPAPAQSIRLYLIRQKRYNHDFAMHMPLAKYKADQKDIHAAFERLAQDHVFTLVEPYKTMCVGGTCPLMGEGRSYYQDDDHISPHGSIRFKAMYKPIFQ